MFQCFYSGSSRILGILAGFFHHSKSVSVYKTLICVMDTFSSASSQWTWLRDLHCATDMEFFVSHLTFTCSAQCVQIDPFLFPSPCPARSQYHIISALGFPVTKADLWPPPAKKKKKKAFFAEGFFLHVVRENCRQLSSASKYVNMQCYIEQNRKKLLIKKFLSKHVIRNGFQIKMQPETAEIHI